MNSPHASAPGLEIQMKANDFFVSKTDLKSHITYVNQGFCYMSGYTPSELISRNHDIVRCNLMPHGIYNLLWEHLKSEEEFFGYIANQNKDGTFYWAFINVTPCYEDNKLTGYFAVQREPSQQALAIIKPLYLEMCNIEKHAQPTLLLPLSSAALWQAITKEYQSYAEFILSL
jgi:PAS domain S-box-containing protein